MSEHPHEPGILRRLWQAILMLHCGASERYAAAEIRRSTRRG